MTSAEHDATPGARDDVSAVHLGATEPWKTLRGRNVSKADVLLYRLGDRTIAVKDYGARPWLVRHGIGRFFVRRECRAYEVASGAPGLPAFLGRIGPFALALEYVDAVRLGDLVDRGVDAVVFDRLAGIVSGLHDRGIALADLHHRDVLVAEDDTVHVVDLAMSWVTTGRSGRLSRSVFRRLAQLDRIAVARMRARWMGTDRDAAVDEVGGPGAAWYTRGRRLKAVWNRIRGRDD